MDPQAQASFIPKKPLISGAGSSSGYGGILWFGAVLIFIASVVAAGASFAYQQYMQSSIAAADASLQRAQAAFDPAVIQDLIKLDSRLNQASVLIHNHVRPSAVFDFLGNTTLQNVRFDSFEYSLNPNGTATLLLSGEALDFPSVALQSDAFSKSRYLKDVLFSDINVSPGNGRIVFKVQATIDPSLILYRTAVTQGGIKPITPDTTGAAPASASTSPSVQVQAPAAPVQQAPSTLTKPASSGGSAVKPFGSTQ